MASTGEKVLQLRRSLGLSIRGLAKRADVSPAYLSRIEQGDANPTVAILGRIAAALGVAVDELLDASSPPHREEPMPNSLKRFIENNRTRFPELDDPDWRKTLAGVRLRGKYPENDKEWLNIFTIMKTALED